VERLLDRGRQSDERPLTRHLHIGFVSPSIDAVDAFWQALTNAGYTDDGPPGPRPQYREEYYGAFVLRFPDGNSAEPCTTAPADDGGRDRHLWLRVRDVAATRRFYETIAPVVGFASSTTTRCGCAFAARAVLHVRNDERPATENVHLAFPPETTRGGTSSTASPSRPAIRQRVPGERLELPPGLLRRVRARSRRQTTSRPWHQTGTRSAI